MGGNRGAGGAGGAGGGVMLLISGQKPTATPSVSDNVVKAFSRESEFICKPVLSHECQFSFHFLVDIRAAKVHVGLTV